MASILIITHRYDDFMGRAYLVKGFFRHWAEFGHKVIIAPGRYPDAEADLVIQHVDCSVLPPEYAEILARYPVVINGTARDIRKRAISSVLVRPGDGWHGPVIVKADLNCGGVPEWRHNWAAANERQRLPHPLRPCLTDYPIYQSPDEVPEETWANPDLVVERFVPEQDEKGYWLRTWLFFGDNERCSRSCSPKPIVKGPDVFLREPAPVPEEMRLERQRLGFDYGKFDFVVHQGRPYLLDANRTPGSARNLAEEFARGALNLAHGIDGFVKKANGIRG